MKPTIYILACLFATNTSVAQTQTTTHDEGENSGKVIVRQQSVQRVDSFLLIDLTLDLTPLIVKSSRSVELTPLLSGGGYRLVHEIPDFRKFQDVLKLGVHLLFRIAHHGAVHIYIFNPCIIHVESGTQL